MLAALCSVFVLTGCKEKETKHEVRPVKVKTMNVQLMPVNGGQSYSGTIEEESGTTLSFSAAGTIKSMLVDEGQTVKKGQLIAVIDDASLKSAHEATVASLSQAKDAYSRMKQLHEAGSLPDIKWIEVQTKLSQAEAAERISRKSLTDTRLYAPFGGYISRKEADAGQNVVPGMPVVKLVNIGSVKVKLSVPEDEIANIKVGKAVSISVPALGNSVFEGVITEKGVSADALSRAYDVKALVRNGDRKLLPGMVCEAYTDLSSAGRAILLPAGIIQIDADNGTFVWTVAGGKAVKTAVSVGGNVGDNVIISGGLSAGSVVITEGQQKVSNGMKIKE